jgi:hypothetical protein
VLVNRSSGSAARLPTIKVWLSEAIRLLLRVLQGGLG